MVAEPGAGAGGKRRSLRDKNDVVMIDGDTSGLVVTAFYNFSFLNCTKVVFYKSEVKACCHSCSWKYPGNF